MTAPLLKRLTSPEQVTRGALVALGLSIPISTALDGVLLGVIVLGWLLANRFRETAQVVRANPVASAACLWFAAHLLAAIYSIGAASDIMRGVGRAAIFLLIPVAIVMLDDGEHRERALYAIMVAIALTVVLSSLLWAGIIPADAKWLKNSEFPANLAFKRHLTQNIFVAFGAFLFAVQAGRATRPQVRFLFWGLAALSICNVLLMVEGRTGQVLLFVLIVYYGAWRAGRYGLVAALAAAAVIGAGAYSMPDSTVHKRATRALSEALEWQAGVMPDTVTSVGQRLDFYRNSLGVASAHPLTGVGTGGFAAAYEKQVSATNVSPTRNPHNEYLLQAVELGVIGITLLVGFFLVQWRTAGGIRDSGHRAIARALVLCIVVASLFTSALNDHAEGLLFVWLSGVLFSGWSAADAGPALQART